jgi:O-antigen/teichoic acid export membrane protein
MLVAVSERQPPLRDEFTADERGRYLVQPEWLGQATLINVGLIVLCIYLVSTLVGTGVNDWTSRIAIVALVIAMPLLAILSISTELQRTRRYASFPWYFMVAQAIGQGSAVIGFGAALWHVWWPATVALVVSGALGLFVYQAYYRRLEKDNKPERAHRTAHKAPRS